ncbi:hypothetical protein K474DRAFT_1670257 [Panus rudis PR-1116 ss-1]|nr:hypothetical protein K474DRAFT_1670257 [Panus rudis PR-1116 ss-1]
MSLFPLPTPEYTLGAGLVLATIGFIPYGVTVAQAYAYMYSYPDDPYWLKSLVILVTLLETLFSALVIHVVYHFCIVAWGNFILVDVLFWSAPSCVVILNLVLMIVQGYYIHRLWILSGRNKALTAFFRSRTWTGFEDDHLIQWTVETACIVSAVTDALIAATLTYYIRRSRSRLRRIDSAVRWIIMYSVNTGAISMVMSISIAVTFITLKRSVTFAGLVLLVGRTYANSFLGTLNARRILKSSLRRKAYAEAEEFDLDTGPSGQRPALLRLEDLNSGERQSSSSGSIEPNLKKRAESSHGEPLPQG